MAYLCAMCVWCPQRLGVRVGSPRIKVKMVVSHCVAAGYSPRATSTFFCCCFLGQGFSVVLGLSWKQQVLLTTERTL